MSAIVHSKKEANEMRKISLSYNTVSKRISKIGKDQREQLIPRIKESRKFTIQLDELTDKVPSTSYLNFKKRLLIYLLNLSCSLNFLKTASHFLG